MERCASVTARFSPLLVVVSAPSAAALVLNGEFAAFPKGLGVLSVDLAGFVKGKIRPVDPRPPRSLSNRKISLRLAKGRQFAGFDVGGSVSAETFSRPEPILGHLSLRGGIPFPGKLALSCRWPAPALAMWQIEHTSELF